MSPVPVSLCPRAQEATGHHFLPTSTRKGQRDRDIKVFLFRWHLTNVRRRLSNKRRHLTGALQPCYLKRYWANSCSNLHQTCLVRHSWWRAHRTGGWTSWCMKIHAKAFLKFARSKVYGLLRPNRRVTPTKPPSYCPQAVVYKYALRLPYIK